MCAHLNFRHFLTLFALIFFNNTTCWGQSQILFSKSARTYQQQGDRYFKQEAFTKALSAYNQALKINPKTSMLYTRRGKTYLNLNAYQRASEDFDHALHLNPKATDAYVHRGEAALNMGHYLDALSDFQQAITLTPSSEWGPTLRTLLNQDVEEKKQKVIDFGKIVAKNPAPEAVAEQLIKNSLIENHKKRCKISVSQLLSFRNTSGMFFTAQLIEHIASGRQCRIAIK